jgi:hypothetical protein
MRPSRVIVGEVRAEECLDLLLALKSGLPGMASLHTNSAREALVKMCTLPLLAGAKQGRRERARRRRVPCPVGVDHATPRPRAGPSAGCVTRPWLVHAGDGGRVAC